MPMMHAAAQGGRVATAGWLLVAAVSAVSVWTAAGLQIGVTAIPPDRVGGPAVTAAPVQSPQPVVPRPIGAYGATLERPLFEATRRPRPAVDETQGQQERSATAIPPAPAEALRVVGIMRPRKGSANARVLVRASDAQAIWVETGASIGGWTVSAIGDRTITVESGGQRREISLFNAPAGSAN